MSDAAIARIAEKQRALVTHAQALAAGATADGIRWRTKTGRWHEARRGVYAIAGAPPDWEQTALAAALATGPDALLSCATAAVVWHLPRAVIPGRINVLHSDIGRPRLDGVIGHRSRLIVPADRSLVRNIPVTSVARTIIDCSGDATCRPLIGWWIDHALRERLVTLDQLARTLGRLRAGPGRKTRLIRLHLDKRAYGYQPGDSQPEVRIADWLEAAGLGRPTLGHRVIVNGKKYKTDGLYVPERVGFEYQSWEIHGAGQREIFDADARRINLLRAAGYDIYEFTSESTEREVVEVMGLALLRRRSELEIGRATVRSTVARPISA